VLDAEHLRVRAFVTLRGDFSFDAISPSGSWLYLVQYLSRRDPTRYAVRAYDVQAGRLVPGPIVDPTEPDERMGGYPLARAWSPDRRWAYTLYDGGGEEPFVHALDTSGRTARCIDLGALAGRNDLSGLRLGLRGGGATLAVRDARGVPVTLIDTRTFSVREPVEQSPPPTTAKSGFPWALVGAPAAGILLALVSMGALRLRRRPTPAAPRET
jgi:hypothetical protein